MNKLFRKRSIFRIDSTDGSPLKITVVDNRDGTVTAKVSPEGSQQSWKLNGQDVASGNPATFSANRGDRITCDVVDHSDAIFDPEAPEIEVPEPEVPGAGEPPVEPPVIEPPVIEPPVIEPPVVDAPIAPSVEADAAFDPAEPVEGDTVILREPVFAGTAPLDMSLASVTLDGRDIRDRLVNVAGDLSVPEAAAGELRAAWTATNASGSATSEAIATITAAEHTDDLAQRLSLSAHRTNAVEGDGVYLAVEGLTRDETGTWGFKWDMDDAESGGYRLMSGMPDKYQNRNTPQGHITAYSWRSPGIKSVRCKVIPPSWSGIPSVTLTLDVDIRALSERFGPSETWVVDPSGAFTDAPAGKQVTSVTQAHNEAVSAGGGLVLLAEGQTVSLSSDKGWSIPRTENNHLYYTSYGPGATKPIFDVSKNGFNSVGSDQIFAVTFRNIDFRGGYDPVTGSGARTTAIRCRNQNHVTIVDCDFRGVEAGISSIGNLTGDADSLMVFDSSAANWENYALYMDEPDIAAIIGCTGIQSPSAVVGSEAKAIGRDSNQPDHSFTRISTARKFIFYNNQGFTNTGWSSGNPADSNTDSFKHHQPLLRMGSLGVIEDGCSVFIGSNYLEGNGLDFAAGAAKGVQGRGLIVVHGNYNLYTASTGGSSFGHTGFYFSSNVYVIPNVPQESNKDGRFYVVSTHNPTEALPQGAFRISHNTLVSLTDIGNETKNDVIIPQLIQTAEFAERSATYGWEYSIENQLVAVPNRVIEGDTEAYDPHGPLQYPVFGPAPFYEGMRIEQEDGSIYFDAKYASPADAAVLPRTSRNVAVDPTEYTHALDFFGRVRPARPSIGAVEHEPLEDPA